MSFYRNKRILSRRFRLVQDSFLEKEGLPFAEVLPEEQIERVFAEEGVAFAQEDDCVYTPAITLWAFLSQAIHEDTLRSCLAAVSRVMVLLVVLGRKPCAKNNGAYCRARAKLPEVVVRRLTTEVAIGCEAAVPSEWLWHGRHVLLVDGTTLSMPDTEQNQAEYPQNPAQEPGLGFPIVRTVVLLSLATAMLQGMALAPYSGKETGEPALLRQLLSTIAPETILLSDGYYGGYFMIALALLGQRDFVVHLHQGRKLDLAKMQRLGRGDYLVRWKRPQRPPWMELACYARIPRSMTVRLVQVQVSEPGFRVASFWVVTSLTNVREYPREEIAGLYRRRWLVELDIRAIKATLGMEILRSKSPAMVRREIWSCLLAYNLLRKALLEAAYAAGLSPRQLSFATALQTVAASWELLACADEELAERLIAAQLASLVEQIVGDRPNRVEPRAAKRRPHPQHYLKEPRAVARAKLLAGWGW